MEIEKTTSENTVRPDQIKQLHTLLSNTGKMEYKREMINDVTGGRTNSSKELLWHEAQILINHLKSIDPKSTAMDNMRKKIIHYAHEMGWRKKEQGKWVADMDSINSWCNKYSFAKKPLNEYTYKELPKLVTQFEQGPYKSYINNI
jgi:hypothetical protein